MSCKAGKCENCGKVGPRSTPSLCHSCYGKEYYQKNKESILSRVKDYRLRNPKVVKSWRKDEKSKSRDRAYRFKKKYGLTLEEYDQLVALPCELCGEDTKIRVCDHSHVTGAVRGSLCVACNIGVGILEGRGVEWVKRCLHYLDY